MRSFCATLLLQPAALMDDALPISAFDHVIIVHLHVSLMIFIVCELASLHSAGLVTIYKSASTVCRSCVLDHGELGLTHNVQAEGRTRSSRVAPAPQPLHCTPDR